MRPRGALQQRAPGKSTVGSYAPGTVADCVTTGWYISRQASPPMPPSPMSITFDEPPISEVVLGQVFVNRPDFLVPHYGQFWELLRDQYPKCSHASPIVDAPGQFHQDPASGAWLPRVWFVGIDDTRLVQVQQDRLYVNWRQTDKAETYIRFPAIESEFHRVWSIFEPFVARTTGQPLQTTRLDLTYINIIPKNTHWSTMGDLGVVLRDFGWQPGPRLLPKPSGFAGQYEFNIDGNTKLLVRINSARRVFDNADVLRLELTAQGLNQTGEARVKWIAAAHDLIVGGFKDLTTKLMHKEVWKLKG
jgi:uncharacterized protein (TIGR04255 family)